MQIREIEIFGYRSVHELRLPLGPLTVIVGPNGCGKSNIYQSLQLLPAAASGQFAHRIVHEGGMSSISWAGRRHKNEQYRVKLAVTFEEFRYEIEFGLIPISERPSDGTDAGLSLFKRDPDIKEERIQFIDGDRKVDVLERKRSSISARNMDGRRVSFPATFSNGESVLSELREPQKYPEISVIREELSKWRFYHDFRTDMDSPIRQPQLATMTPILSDDGSDFTAALATINSIGDRSRLAGAVDRAFPGSQILIDDDDDDGILTFGMSVPGLHRHLTARELSDGTLQYLCLLAALLTPRPAPFMVLNEPESSIHPDLFEPLAELLLVPRNNSQILLTTHSTELANFIAKRGKAKIIELEKVAGATQVVGAKRIAIPGDDDAD